MPILWRYQFKTFFAQFFLAIACCIALIVSLKINDLSKLLSLGTPPSVLLHFLALQIPLLLPIIIGFCALISGYLTVQKLVSSNALSTLRSSGLNINAIFSPLYFIGCVLLLVNFFLVATIIPHCRVQTHQLFTDASQINPLFLLKNRKIPLVKDAFIHLDLNATRNQSSNACIILQNPYTKYLNLLKAKTFVYNPGKSVAIENASIITTLEQDDDSVLPTILYENVGLQTIPLNFFTDPMGPSYPTKVYEILNFKELFAALGISSMNSELVTEKKEILSDIFSRFSIMTLPFLLMLFGMIFAIPPQNLKWRPHTFLLVLSSLLCFSGTLCSKTIRSFPMLALLASLIPFVLCLTVALKYKSNVDLGKL